MQQIQPFKKKRKCVIDLEKHRKHALKSIIVKDLPIHDIRWNLGYLTKLHEPILCKEAPVNGFRSSADVLNKVVFKVFMSYSDAFQLGSTSHPLQNVILKPYNYLEGPKPGILKKMSDASLPPNDYDIYEVHIPENKTIDDIYTVKIINWLWVNQRHNYDAWMKMITFLSQNTIQAGPIENDFIKKCISTRVSVNSLIGDRGLCHGLCDLKVPILKTNPYTGLYNLPEWALSFDSDDNSSFHLSSPDNSDFDTDSVDSGPIGVACNRPRITGYTSFTETSSDSSSKASSKFKISRLDLYIDGHSGDYWDRRMRKRFDLYMQTSFNERRNRRSIREARRKVRLEYDSERRMMEPVFNAEAKRAEALAAERVRAEMRHQKSKLRVNNNPTPGGKSIEHYLYRYKQFNHKLKSQLESSWTRYYGEKFIAKYLNNSERRNDISLKCWVSPVPYIHQTGINGGFSAISMAIRQMRLIEVILCEEEERNSDELKDMLRQLYPNGAIYLNSLKKKFERFGVNSLSELNHSTMTYLLSMMREEAKLTNWGEIFSGNILAQVAVIANYYNTRYKIRFVRQDILANYKNDGSSEAEQLMSIVQRLARGQLIAVCFDADEKKRPTANGGRSAYWTLLCGVIVGFPSKKPSKEPLPEEKFKSKDMQLAYTYHYEPENHLLTPMGFVCPETDRPVDMDTIKKRAEQVTEEPNNSDTHSINCKILHQMCQKCTIEYVDKKLDLERDGDSVWVVARHRDEYVVWTLRELAKSNRQLRTPGKKILKTISQEKKDEWKIVDALNGRCRPGPDLKSINSAYRQQERERLNMERRKNREVCTMVVEQMDSLSRENPDLIPYELAELLDLPMLTSDSAEVWKSAATKAYEFPVEVLRTIPILPVTPTTEEPMDQMPEAPPPLPIPTSPTPVAPPINTGSPNTVRPYILQSGPNFDYCLAKQYVCFEPLEDIYQNYGMDSVPDVNSLNDILVTPVQFHFSIEGKLASWIRKEQLSQRATPKNRAPTSATFTG